MRMLRSFTTSTFVTTAASALSFSSLQPLSAPKLRQKDVIGTGASRLVYSGMHPVNGQGEEWIGFFACAAGADAPAHRKAVSRGHRITTCRATTCFTRCSS